MFNSTPDDLDMHVIYDVSHNIAKVEEHFVGGKQRTLLVHRKGSTRAFPPHHPLIPVDYQVCTECFNNICIYLYIGTRRKPYKLLSVYTPRFHALSAYCAKPIKSYFFLEENLL